MVAIEAMFPYPLTESDEIVHPLDLSQFAETHVWQMPHCLHDEPGIVIFDSDGLHYVLSCRLAPKCKFAIDITSCLHDDRVKFSRYPLKNGHGVQVFGTQSNEGFSATTNNGTRDEDRGEESLASMFRGMVIGIQCDNLSSSLSVQGSSSYGSTCSSDVYFGDDDSSVCSDTPSGATAPPVDGQVTFLPSPEG
ncbi:hypothetical protein CC2G_007992 [Coprinopsis cinerea AmutBmut pab1-1]|nr:hypothetical protein CC2G_007992 [Coprinopsis cinerea AmutBmut pab1-1]